MTYRATVHQTDNPVNEYTGSSAPTPALALEGLRELAADRYLSDPINADLMARVNAILSRLT